MRGSGFDTAALQPSEIEAWAKLNAIALEPFEAEVLFRLDAKYLAVARKARPAARNPKGLAESVPSTDSAGIKTMFRAMGARPPKKSQSRK